MFKNLRRRIACLIDPSLQTHLNAVGDSISTLRRQLEGRMHRHPFDQLRAANVARNPEWFPDGKAPVLPASFRGLELAGEVGEGVEAALSHLAMLTASAGRICNILKKLERERLGLNGSRSTKEALAEEIGDFIICADLVGMDFDIAVWPAVVSKFNATSEKLGMKTRLGERTVAMSPVLGMGYKSQAPHVFIDRVVQMDVWIVDSLYKDSDAAEYYRGYRAGIVDARSKLRNLFPEMDDWSIDQKVWEPKDCKYCKGMGNQEHGHGSCQFCGGTGKS